MEENSSVAIDEDSWIGTKATIIGKVHKGKHCVIGANSVVTKSIPDYCIAVGSPVRIIKRYKAGWQDVLEKDITKFYIYNTNPVSNVLSFFLRFSSDVIKSSELRDENYDKFITSTSQLTQSRNNGGINSAASFALNFALDKIRVLKGGSNEGEDPKVTGMKTGEYYENEE